MEGAEGMKKPLDRLHCKRFSGFLLGTPEGTRTPNIQNRNLTLYPIELRAHRNKRQYSRIFSVCKVEIFNSGEKKIPICEKSRSHGRRFVVQCE